MMRCTAGLLARSLSCMTAWAKLLTRMYCECAVLWWSEGHSAFIVSLALQGEQRGTPESERGRDARHAEDVDQEVVPRPLLDVALAQRRRREVRRAVRKRVDKDLRVRQVARVLERRRRRRVVDVALDVLRRRVGLVGRRVAVGEDGAHRFEEVPPRLLRDHVRVALPVGGARVQVDRRQPRVRAAWRVRQRRGRKRTR